MFSLRHPFLQNRAGKKRLNVIIVAEGAIDRSNTPITTDYIKDVSTELCAKSGDFATSAASCMTSTTVLLPWCGFDSFCVPEVLCQMHAIVW